MSVELESVELESEESVEAGAATNSPIAEPKTMFNWPSSSATPSSVNVELDPSASGAK